MIKRRDYPSSIRVGASIYGVRFVRVFPPDAQISGVTLDGFCCYEGQILYIATGLSPRDRLSTFVHELLHALDDEHEIDLSHDQIYKLEEALLKLILDNDLIP